MPNASGTAVSLHDSPDEEWGKGYIVAGAEWRGPDHVWHDGADTPTCVGTDTASFTHVRIGLVTVKTPHGGTRDQVSWLERDPARRLQPGPHLVTRLRSRTSAERPTVVLASQLHWEPTPQPPVGGRMATSEIVITTREYFLLSLAAALPAGLVAAGPWFNGLLLQGVAFFIVFTVLLLLGLVLTARTKRRRQMPAPRKPTD